MWGLRRSTAAPTSPGATVELVHALDLLGWRFDEAAVIVDGVAHREDCPRLPEELPADAVRVPAGGTWLSIWAPRTCECSPRFLTLLTNELHTAAGPVLGRE